MAKSAEKLEALRLRRSGMSIKVVARMLNVSSGSVSKWCRDIELTKEQSEHLRTQQILSGNKGRIIGAEMNRQKRIDNIRMQRENARKIIKTLSERDKLMLGIALYWGEGVKADGSTTGMVNSDPAIILFARNWFEQLGVSRDLFSPYIYISEIHRPREQIIRKFWSKLLEIPEHQFPKTVFIKTRLKKVYENHNAYYGVLALRVRKGSTLKYLIRGLIQACAEEAGVKADLSPLPKDTV